MTLKVNVAGSAEWPRQLRCLLLGNPGVGKTTLAAYAPNPIFANARCGLTTLSKLGNVPYVNVSTEMDLFALKKALDNPPSLREKLFGRPIDTLVIDSIDEFQRLLLIQRLKKENRPETKPEDWGWLSDRLHAIFSGLTQITDLNLIVIGHLKEVTIGNDVIVKPAIQGSFCEAVHSYVDMSLLMRAGPQIVEILDDPQSDPDSEDDTDVTPHPRHISLAASGVEIPDIQITIRGTSRRVFSTPQPEAEWVCDSTGVLEDVVEVDQMFFTTLLDKLKNSTIDFHTSTVFEINEDVFDEPTEVVVPVEEADGASESTPVEEHQMTVDEILDQIDRDTPKNCSACGTEVKTQTWIDLSNLKFGETLCASCYKNK